MRARPTNNTPKLFDTHAHFSRAGGEYTIESQISRAIDAGVDRIIAVGGSDELNKAAVDAAELYPKMIPVALGFDRDNAETLSTPDSIKNAMEYIKSQKVILKKEGINLCAIGEIGLDYHYSPDSAELQRNLFAAQLKLAAELKLPVIIHSREADADTLEALTAHAAARQGDPNRIGVLHCFTGGSEFATKLLKLGYHISFSGIVTFLNADPLRETAKTIPAEKILIETDSPYLAPAPMRGNRNEPAFVKHVAERLAEVRSTTSNELIQQTYLNAAKLFLN
jgi:TatD DNase family protein